MPIYPHRILAQDYYCLVNIAKRWRRQSMSTLLATPYGEANFSARRPFTESKGNLHESQVESWASPARHLMERSTLLTAWSICLCVIPFQSVLFCSPWCYIGKRRLETAIQKFRVRQFWDDLNQPLIGRYGQWNDSFPSTGSWQSGHRISSYMASFSGIIGPASVS